MPTTNKAHGSASNRTFPPSNVSRKGTWDGRRAAQAEREARAEQDRIANAGRDAILAALEKRFGVNPEVRSLSAGTLVIHSTLQRDPVSDPQPGDSLQRDGMRRTVTHRGRMVRYLRAKAESPHITRGKETSLEAWVLWASGATK